MFWANNYGKDIIELKRRNLFLAEFVGATNFNWVVGEDEIKNLKFVVKKFNLPSLNIPFERLHANQFVHYFHVGEVNWEPITITFVDMISNDENIPNWQNIFFYYLNDNLINSNNRTSMLDLATFCQHIKITSITTLLDSTDNEVLNTGTTYDIASDPNDPNKTILTNKQKFDNRNQIRDEFFIFKPKITKIDFGSLDYSSDESNEVTITFLPEWCDRKEVPT